MTTTQFDFSNDDWETIASTPVVVGFAVAKAEDSGYLGSLRETRTLIATIAAGAEDNPARSLIDGAASGEETKAILKDYGTTAPDVLADLAVDACTALVGLLAESAEPEEALGYRRWVLEVAGSVAEAAKEQRVRISPPEADLIDRITKALDLA